MYVSYSIIKFPFPIALKATVTTSMSLPVTITKASTSATAVEQLEDQTVSLYLVTPCHGAAECYSSRSFEAHRANRSN